MLSIYVVIGTEVNTTGPTLVRGRTPDSSLHGQDVRGPLGGMQRAPVSARQRLECLGWLELPECRLGVHGYEWLEDSERELLRPARDRAYSRGRIDGCCAMRHGPNWPCSGRRLDGDVYA